MAGQDEGRGGGVDPAHTYAAGKLGYTVTDDNHQQFTDEQLQAWDDAVAEYESDVGGGC